MRRCGGAAARSSAGAGRSLSGRRSLAPFVRVEFHSASNPEDTTMSTFRAALLVTMMVAGQAGIGLATAQEPKPPASPPSDQHAAGTVGDWIRDLGSDSFRTRLQAENNLRQAGSKALAELRQAAGQSEDHEVQWRARRLLRQIERADAGGLVQRSRDDDGQVPMRPWWNQRGLPADGIQQRFEELFRDLERFGLDVPRASFFHDDFFRDLQDQMQNGASRSQGMSMQIGPDGTVRVEIEEQDADGKVEKKVYEAPDLQTFQSQYPEVLQRGGLGLGGRAFGGLGLSLRSDDPLMPLPLWRGGRADPFRSQPRPGFDRIDGEHDVDAENQVHAGVRLGVTVRSELPDELREHLALEPGVGLMVQSVMTDSLASGLGLRAGDIVVRIAGRAIGSPADVQAALGAVEAGAAVEVAFLRKGVEQVATVNKPAAKAEVTTPTDRRLRRRTADGEPAKVR